MTPAAGPPSKRANNFDTLRILAAGAVLVSHAFPITYGRDYPEPLSLVSGGQTTAGSLAVAVFFVISGYLITQSFQRWQDPLAFVVARSLRILPGLTAMTLCVGLLLGPVLTTMPLADYLGSAELARFLAGSISLLSAGDMSLPRVFVDTPYPRYVNGSLWTLPIEVQCYAAVLLLGVAGLLNRAVVTVLFTASIIAVWRWVGGGHMQLAAYFLSGAMLYLWRPPFVGWLALLCVAAWTMAFAFTGLRIANATAGAYVLIFVALSPSVRLPNLSRVGDLSYGTYIWAFPIQQTVTLVLGAAATWYWNVLLSLPAVLFLAWLSWHYVEEPALRLRSRMAFGQGLRRRGG